jgi:hypothetical protein
MPLLFEAELYVVPLDTWPPRVIPPGDEVSAGTSHEVTRTCLLRVTLRYL